MYRYGTTSGFPTQTYQSTNYWADVVFQTSTGPDTTPPTVQTVAPASGATGVSQPTNVTATFSEAMDPSTITTSTFELRDPLNALVSAVVTYDAATRTATLDPAQSLASSTTYTARIRGGSTDPRVKDQAGNALANTFTWSFTTAASGGQFSCPCSLWTSSTVPAATDPDTGAVELGVRFQASVDGQITALRFYKSVNNTGTHVGRLWTGSGTLLASVTFTGETASGWQQATLASPVSITANTVYVATYHTSVGRYSVNQGYFNTAYSNPPLSAPAAANGGNGVYRYGPEGTFPTQTYQGSNYWVDVVFQPK